MSSEPAFHDDDVIDYRYYLDLLLTVLYKYYRLILAFCAVCVIGAVFVSQSQEPSYSATVTMHIAQKDRDMFGYDRWYWNEDEKFEDTQIGILRSHILYRKVVEALSLHEVEHLQPKSFDPGIRAAIRSLLGSTEEPVTFENASEEVIRARAAELQGLVSIAKPPNRENSNLLNITVRTGDPELSTSIANTLAEEYISLVFQNEIETARKNEQFLSERLTVLREDLRKAERRLQAYRENENIVARGSGRYDEVDEELAALSSRFFEAREARLRQENLYQQIKDLPPGGSGWDNLPAIANHPQVSAIQRDLIDLNRRKDELSKRYGSRHNTMIALETEISTTRSQLTRAIANIVQGIRNDYELSQRIERAAEEALQEARDKKQERGRQSFELTDLEQDVETKREVYNVFLERLNQDGAAGDARNDNIWIADPAVVPSAGQRTPISRAAIIALILSFGFSTGLGVLFEITRNRISSGEDVEKLHMPLLGYLPLVENEEEKPGILLEEYVRFPDSRFAEALRTIRTALSLGAVKQEGATRLLVTSTQTGEGKSSVSLSLASAFGQTAKVLVIDADLRKPSFTRILGESSDRTGLTDILANNSSTAVAIESRQEEKFDVLYAGSPSIKPLELLASPRLGELLEELDSQYDIIIIDSPPCLPVSDAYVISQHVDSIVYVVKSDAVPAPQVKKSLEGFEQTNADIAGLLVNQIDLEAMFNYRRYKGYYSYDGYGKTEAVGLSVVK